MSQIRLELKLADLQKRKLN